MTMYVNKAMLARSAALRAQHDYIKDVRKRAALHNNNLARGIALAANVDIPADAWRDFDRNVVELMSGPEADNLLNDLMPLARNVGVGKIVSEWRKGAGELEVRSSIDGEHAKPVNSVGYDMDGTVILVHSTQVGRSWREMEGLREEGFDELVMDQAAAVRNVRKRTADNFVNGTDLSFRGYTSGGIKGSENTQVVNLGSGGGGLNIDLTDPALTYSEAYSAFVAILRLLPGDANLYLSDDVYFNLMRINANATALETILAGLERTTGVNSIKRSDQLTGNELIAFVPRAEFIRPIVGMPITTTPIERVTPMDKFNVLVWGASGLEIRGDADGRSGVVYAGEA